MHLPGDSTLPVHRLAACFNVTTTSYKYYWFLSLVEAVEEGETLIEKERMFAGMVAKAWHTVNYYHLSFGVQDQLQRAIEVIRNEEGLTIDEKPEVIIKTLMSSGNRQTRRQLWHFNAEVPHRFLSPWFNCRVAATAYEASRIAENGSLYELHPNLIMINPAWVGYLQQHARVLKDFCYWNLSRFLQARNPNVPGIPNKLIRPLLRQALNQQRKLFWDVVVNELGSVSCIYTGKPLTVGHYHVEHFIPYSFLTHNLIWNLVPADRSFNSSKSDKLPLMDVHFDRFYEVQRSAVEVIQARQKPNKFLEDYLTLFSSLNSTADIPGTFTKANFRERLEPLITIAANNGFDFMK